MRRPAQVATPQVAVALVLLLLGPVAILPGALDRFVFPKVALVAAGGAVAGWAGARGRLPRHAVVLLGVGAALLVAAALAGAAPLAQLIGLGPRYEGLAVLPVYLVSGLSGARLLGPGRHPEDERLALTLLTLAAVAVAVLAVVETAGLRPLATDVARPGSLLGNASDEGAWGVLVAGPLASAARRFPPARLGVLAALVVVVLSASRGALVGLVVAAAVLSVLAGSARMRGAVVAGVVVVGALSFALPATAPRITGSQPLARATVSGRITVWQETGHLLARHPVLGVGPSGFLDAILAEHTRSYEERIGPANPVDSPHDWLLQALVAGGPGLLAVALAVAVLTAAAGWRKSRPPPGAPGLALDAGLLAGLAGYGAALLFHLTSPGPTCLAALFGGALLAVPADPGALGHRVARTVWPAALAVVLAFAAVAEIPLREGVSALSSGRVEAAQRDFRVARALRPWDVEVNLTAGNAFASAASAGADPQAARDALGWLQPALARVPGSEEVLEDRALAHEALGNYAPAIRLLDSAVATDRFNPLLLLRLGVLHAEARQLGPAAGYLLAAARLDPGSPTPWEDLALVYQEEGRPAAAAAARERAASLAR
jgi:Flp pilus assembly protein TadD